MGTGHKPTRSLTLNISRKNREKITRFQQAPAQIFYVERGVKDNVRKVTQVTAGDVFFSIAEMEK
jgi:hypothetical protein